MELIEFVLKVDARRTRLMFTSAVDINNCCPANIEILNADIVIAPTTGFPVRLNVLKLIILTVCVGSRLGPEGLIVEIWRVCVERLTIEDKSLMVLARMVEISSTTDCFARPARLTGAKGEIKNGFALLAMYKFALFLEGSFR